MLVFREGKKKAVDSFLSQISLKRMTVTKCGWSRYTGNPVCFVARTSRCTFVDA